MKTIKEELQFEENLKQKLEFICKFSKAISTFLTAIYPQIMKSIKKSIKRYKNQKTKNPKFLKNSYKI